MNKLPFKMRVDSDMEKFRHDTFWTKEPETIEWIKAFSDGDVFFDVGANIGIYSLFCAAIHPKSIIVAFEPHPINFARLVGNIIDNGFNGRLKAHQFMIADATREAYFDFKDIEPGCTGGQMVKPMNNRIDHCRSLDDLITYSFDFDMPNHIKIDIDGQEDNVIKGMSGILKDGRLKSVLVELDQSKNSFHEIVLSFLENEFTMNNKFNCLKPHSTDRRIKEGINVRNVIFTRCWHG